MVSVCAGCAAESIGGYCAVDCVTATLNVEVGFSFDFGDIGDVTEGVVRVDSSRNGLAFGGACGDGQGLAGESLGGFGAGDVKYVVAGDEDVGGVDGGYWFSLSMGGLRACWLECFSQPHINIVSHLKSHVQLLGMFFGRIFSKE